MQLAVCRPPRVRPQGQVPAPAAIVHVHRKPAGLGPLRPVRETQVAGLQSEPGRFPAELRTSGSPATIRQACAARTRGQRDAGMARSREDCGSAVDLSPCICGTDVPRRIRIVRANLSWHGRARMQAGCEQARGYGVLEAGIGAWHTDRRSEVCASPPIEP